MNDLYKFMGEHPVLTFFLAAVIFSGLFGIVEAVFFRLPNRILRHLNIKKNGWPPAHCDADGDFKPDTKEDES